MMHPRNDEFPPVRILLLLRDRVANDWPTLCREFKISPDRFATPQMFLHETLVSLRSAGLIEFESSQEHRWAKKGIEGRIEVTENWTRIQTALGISLAEIAEMQPSESMVVKPYFGHPQSPPTKSDLFVLMPFTEELLPVYQDHIVKVVKSLKLTVARADDFFSSQSVMSDIWNAICDARLIIADCTGRNPNVFYEIGLAHVVGKRVVLLTQSKDDIPFDIRHFRFIEYDYTPRGMKDFEKRLLETVKSDLYIFD